MGNFNIKQWQKTYLINESEDTHGGVTGDNTDIKTVTQLANKFLAVSKELRKNEIKGLDIGEIGEISTLLDMVLKGASSGSIKTVLQQVEKVLAGRINISPEDAAEPIADPKDDKDDKDDTSFEDEIA